MPINTFETCHNPEMYQVFHSNFQSVMSFTSFSLKSLHAGSILHILGLQVSDAVDRRRAIQRGPADTTALLAGKFSSGLCPGDSPPVGPAGRVI